MENEKQPISAETAINDSGRHLFLQLKPKFIPMFFQLLGQGFSVDVQTGATVKDLLCKQLGIQEDYLAKRISTIFLNSKVVDDVNSTIVNEGAILALSGAMPGLVGATLRSGGFYAAMRSQISYDESKLTSLRGSAPITLKMLNLVVKDLGPIFLQRGIWLKSENLQEFIKRHMEDLKPGLIACELDSQPVEAESLAGINWESDMVLLQVNPEAFD